MSVNRLDQNYLKTLTVLYVEDDDDTRAQFSEFLRRPVGNLITAANGAEGLEAFVQHTPDIVVTDILMPVMDGLTMAYEIRGIAASVPIIVVTAFEQTDYLMRAIDIGIDKYVTKPVNSYLLFECLLDCAHRLRAEEMLRLVRLHEIQIVRMKHHETVAQLAAGLAHDYNNLLQSILGNIELLRCKLEPGSECWECLKDIDDCYEHAHELGQMLSLLGNDLNGRMQTAGVMPLIVRSIREMLHDTSVELIQDFPDDIPEVAFNVEHMKLVIASLVTNALEAMPDGGSLHLRAKRVAINEFDALPLLPGEFIMISLHDSGPGIPAEILDNIFSPYFSTKQRGGKKGMGLSLAVSHTIIVKHGGIITAESAPGSGATFNIWLPVTP